MKAKLRRRTSKKFGFLAVTLLIPCLAAYGKQSDAKSTSRSITGVTSRFELVNSVLRSGEPVKIRVTLHNQSTSAVEFRYVAGSFIEHIRVYDARHRQIAVRVNAPFLESGADKVDLQPGEQLVNVVTADLWQIYDLEPGRFELRFYYDLRLIANETLASKSMKRYHSKDWVLWDTKTYPLTVIAQEDSDVKRKSLEYSATTSRKHTFGKTALPASVDVSNRPSENEVETIVDGNIMKPSLAVATDTSDRPQSKPIGLPPQDNRRALEEVQSLKQASDIPNVMELLSDVSLPTQRRVAELPSCVLRGLRNWYQKPFVLVEQGQDFPKLQDIRRAGDGRFRLLFFSELKDDNAVLCFEDHSSLGITHRAIILRRNRSKCSVVIDFAFDLPLSSIEELRVAINTQRSGS